MKNLIKLIIYSFMIFSLMFLIFSALCCKDRTIIVQQQDIQNFPSDKQYAIYKDSQQSYIDTDKDDRHIRWLKLFSKCKYKIGGKYDCLSAKDEFFSSYGANFIKETIPALIIRIERLNALGQLQIRTNQTAQSGDIIIFNANRNGIYHCGVIYDIKNNIIMYMDVNNRTNGIGFPEIDLGSDKIKYIVEPSLSLWIGDLLSKRK